LEPEKTLQIIVRQSTIDTEIIQNLKLTTMRTLNNNQITEKVSTTKGYTWNLKRRYR